MKFMFTGIESHIDKGFGITADAYYTSAEHLRINQLENHDSSQQAEMPQNFLYRHSIELYLKSLIIIFHKKLKLDYGNTPYDSNEPEAFVDGKWKRLYNCHRIDKLYEYWLTHLLLPNIKRLKEVAEKGDWKENRDLAKLFTLICKYDIDSAYFRYPITSNSSLDSKKYTVQKMDAQDHESFVKELQEVKLDGDKGSSVMLILDDEDKFVEAFRQVESLLPEVRDALKEVAFYFYCIHTMTRITLCEGW